MHPENKPVHAANVPTPTPTDFSRGQIPHDQIAQRAEKLWRERNQPSGRDEAIWLEAEAQLKAEAESRPVAGTDSRPYVDEPGQPLRASTKSRDPADAAVQTRSPTENQAKPKGPRIRNQ